ncbi:MAG: hypothetical protein ACQES8_01215 [Thermodesulfobacteriota bacterium]
MFSSLGKSESGTGRPSFTKLLVPENTVKREEGESYNLPGECV